MIKKILSILIAVAVAIPLTICTYASEENNLSSGTPWIDSELEGAITEDMQFDLKDDFAAAINGEWVLNAEYAPGYPFAGTVADVSLLVDDQLTQLITGENPDDDPYLTQVQSLYELYMDWDARNEAGTSPLMPVLDKLESISSIDDLNTFLCLSSEERGYLTGPFNFYSMTDLNDSSRNIIAIDSSELILKDSAEYSNLTERGKLLKDNKLELGRKILIKAGYSEERTDEIINNAMAFETAISEVIPTSDQQSSPDYFQTINNLVTREELETMQGSVPVVSCIIASGVSDEDFTEAMMLYPEWMDTLNNMYTDENAAVIRDDMILKYAIDNGEVLDEECYQWSRSAKNAVNGVDVTMPVDQVAINYIKSNLNWQLARAYVSRYFTQEDKDRIYNMCTEIIAAYKKMLQEEDFLSADTISYACEKLDAMQVFTLYPDDDQWPDTSKLTFKSSAEGGTLWDAITAINGYQVQHDLDKINSANDRTNWPEGALPTMVNASNNMATNSITIYAAICQGGIYNSEMTTEEMYAGIGCIIGHEISHAFDATGSQFDKTGNMANWWTDEDRELFQEKVQKMMDYYSAISPWEGQYIHGEIITGEACADMAGMKIILRIAESVPDFDYNIFFRTYANIWKQKATKERELEGLTNVHPPCYLRINVTLAQFDRFLKTYDIQEGDGMYIAPEDRVAIW